MDHPKANISPSTEISPVTIPNLEEPDLERNPEKSQDVEISMTTEKPHTSQEREGVDNTISMPKKPVSFKLAFVGLAASLFVFQVDATCLGVALPVSHNTLPVLYAAHIND